MYTLNVDLCGKRCLVVGGGAVATRKVETLIKSGADVTVTAPDSSIVLQGMAEEGRLRWEKRAFVASDVEGMTLVFAATDDPAVNLIVTRAAKEEGAWVNVADAPAEGDFFVPAGLERGGVRVSVSTEGASPALAAWLRDRLNEALPEGVEQLAELCRALRSEGIKPNDTEGWKKLFNSGILRDLAQDDHDRVADKLNSTIGPRAVEVFLRSMRDKK
jgi:precorrin-2 dehydrogenase/sirohydrochlorin ferrochelatase